MPVALQAKLLHDFGLYPKGNVSHCTCQVVMQTAKCVLEDRTLCHVTLVKASFICSPRIAAGETILVENGSSITEGQPIGGSGTCAFAFPHQRCVLSDVMLVLVFSKNPDSSLRFGREPDVIGPLLLRHIVTTCALLLHQKHSSSAACIQSPSENAHAKHHSIT